MFGRRSSGNAPKARFRNTFGARSAGEMFARSHEATSGAMQAVKPGRLDRRGFFGRDRDGGVARFQRLSARYSHHELEAMCFAYERARTIYAVSTFAAVCAIPLSALYGAANWQFVFGLLLLAMFCIVKGLQADFSAWRFRQGRMAPLADYLNNKLPSNMQILED